MTKQANDKPAGKAPHEDAKKDAAAREAKGSVHEAIGKLIGDDAVRDEGKAAKQAAAAKKSLQD